MVLSLVGYMAIEVLEGRGGDIFTSAKGLRYAPIALVTFAVAFPIFMMIGRLIGWILNSDERDFRRVLKNKKSERQQKLNKSLRIGCIARRLE